MDLQARSDLIKKNAQQFGFAFCGISKAGFLEEEADRLEQWLSNGHHGKMRYMENHFEKRLDPTKLVPGSKSVISLLYNYCPTEPLSSELKIARYAYGEDYHGVIKDRLRALTDVLKSQLGDFHGRVFVDSAPVMERQWASKSGLGWLGKHSLLINRTMGSYFFIAEMIVDLDLAHDMPLKKDYCGTCTKCIDACPTDAITAGSVDGSKCISYLTIELKESIPEQFRDKMENWMFGCDICQEVCPWNRFATPHQEPAFEPSKWLEGLSENDWVEMTRDVFEEHFGKSPLQRKSFEGVKETVRFLRNKKTP